jgi:cell division protein FtsQ
VVKVSDSADYSFINRSDIRNLLSNKGIAITGKAYGKINTNRIEELVMKHPFVKSVSCYKGLDGYIHIRIKQREPILTVFSGGTQYFVDTEGKVIAGKGGNAPKIMVATGNVNNKIGMERLITVTNYLRENRNWERQITQLALNNRNEVYMVPRVGNFSILVGDGLNLERKFDNLDTFYARVVAKGGSGGYSVVNVKFDNQVVCIKR